MCAYACEIDRMLPKMDGNNESDEAFIMAGWRLYMDKRGDFLTHSKLWWRLYLWTAGKTMYITEANFPLRTTKQHLAFQGTVMEKRMCSLFNFDEPIFMQIIDILLGEEFINVEHKY